MAADKRPLVGILEVDVTRTPLPGLPPRVSVFIDGTGFATQLGRFAFEFRHIVNPAERTAVGMYSFAATNGDILTANATGESYPIEETTLLYIVEEATIDPAASTGRFAATGSFAVYRLFDTVAGKTIGYMDGTITLRK